MKPLILLSLLLASCADKSTELKECPQDFVMWRWQYPNFGCKPTKEQWAEYNRQDRIINEMQKREHEEGK